MFTRQTVQKGRLPWPDRGVGPVLSYAGQIGKTTFAAELKWLPQIGTQNTLNGDYIWFKVGVQF